MIEAGDRQVRAKGSQKHVQAEFDKLHDRIRQLEDELLVTKQSLEKARIDLITGLPRRDSLYEHLDLISEDKWVAVGFCDIDSLKQINSVYGHDVGDDYVRLCADRLRLVMGPADLLVRLGGDEFAFVTTLSPLEFQSALYLAFKQNDTIGVDIGVHPSVSVGIYSGLRGEYYTVLSCAEKAMRVSKMRPEKTDHVSGVEFYDPVRDGVPVRTLRRPEVRRRDIPPTREG